jgi:hypothetical protein
MTQERVFQLSSTYPMQGPYNRANFLNHNIIFDPFHHILVTKVSLQVPEDSSDSHAPSTMPFSTPSWRSSPGTCTRRLQKQEGSGAPSSSSSNPSANLVPSSSLHPSQIRSTIRNLHYAWFPYNTVQQISSPTRFY